MRLPEKITHYLLSLPNPLLFIQMAHTACFQRTPLLVQPIGQSAFPLDFIGIQQIRNADIRQT